MGEHSQLQPRLRALQVRAQGADTWASQPPRAAPTPPRPRPALHLTSAVPSSRPAPRAPVPTEHSYLSLGGLAAAGTVGR